MIAKRTRGQRVGGLLRYLYGPGRFNEHTDPHLVAAWDEDLAALEPAVTTAEGYHRFDTRSLTAALNAPLAAIGDDAPRLSVWQVSLRTAPGDRTLSDAEWGDIARFTMDRVGLAPAGDDQAVRWLAVRHAEDHIHLVATMARQDGRVPRLSFDLPKLRSAARAVEEKYGLQVTGEADKTAARRPARAETEKAARAGARESVRETLRRHVRVAAAGAFTEADFWRRLAEEGVTVKQRFSERNPGEVTGYAVGLSRGDNGSERAGKTSDGEVLLFSGGKLAPDLSLPKLRARWDPADRPLGPLNALTGEARERAWESATAAAAAGAEHVRQHTASGQYEQAADAAWATSDMLSAAARLFEHDQAGPMRAAADDYDRAAREPWKRTPRRSNEGAHLRMGAVMLAMMGSSSVNDAARVTMLVMQLNRLVEAVAQLRQAQGRAVQAAAALRTAEATAAEHTGYRVLSEALATLTDDELTRPSTSDQADVAKVADRGAGQSAENDKDSAARRRPPHSGRSR